MDVDSEEPEEPDKDVYILLGYSYSSLAVAKTLDAVVFLLASIALARGKSNVAVELLRKMSLDLEGVVNFACGAVELGKILGR